jgi:hypothetical protein
MRTRSPELRVAGRTLYRRLLVEHDRWPFGDEGAETEERGG